ncbi:MAG: regulatory protein RecX [Ruminococcaceae bacterium]|nr:regulatory protein RecX [Oscillospiraceae bacterium]
MPKSPNSRQYELYGKGGKLDRFGKYDQSSPDDMDESEFTVPKRRRAERLNGTRVDDAPKAPKIEKTPIAGAMEDSPDNVPDDEINDEIEDCRSDEEALGLIKKSRQKSACEYAMLLVASRSYTEKGLRDKLESKEKYTADEIEDAVAYVKKFGYINDLRLAENSLPKLALRLWGKKKICYYLRSKGISADVVAALDFSDIDFYENCKLLALKNRQKPREKLIRLLLNAGFSSDEVNYAISEVGENALS